MPKKICLILISFGFFAAGCSKLPAPLPDQTSANYNRRLTIAGRMLNVEIADTDAARGQGLSGRQKLDDTQGMLFDFRNTQTARPAFWMKGMRFGLDLIWIKNSTVIGVTRDVPPPKSPDEKLKLYSPPSDIDMALEVNSGWSEKHGIKLGETINFTGPAN